MQNITIRGRIKKASKLSLNYRLNSANGQVKRSKCDYTLGNCRHLDKRKLEGAYNRRFLIDAFERFGRVRLALNWVLSDGE